MKHYADPTAGPTFTTRDPADERSAVATYADATAADATAAVGVAAAAYPAWSALTPVARGRVLSRASQVIESRKADLAELLVREEGKTLAEASGEVGRAADICRFFGGLSYALGGATIPHDLPQNLLYTRREPVGVVGLVTPWNFPVAIPAWKLAPALLCGNAVVLKPSPLAPALAFELAAALAEAGLPAGVLSVVVGRSPDVGAAITADPRVAAVSFTGSNAVGRQVNAAVSARMARVQLEMGGKNPTIVLADADLDLAARLIATAGFGLTGQACTATSRVIVERAVLPALVDRLAAAAAGMKVGPGLSPGVTMGPLVGRPQLQKVLAHVAAARDAGATVAAGGGRLSDGDLAHGHFVQPTVLTHVTPTMPVACEEVFGPVVAVLAADDFDHAIALANGVDLGLSASLVTRDFRRAMLYAERIQAGVVKVNQISTGLALQAPFGGVKGSSNDAPKEQGGSAVEFYSKVKTVYLDYSAG